MWLRIIEAWNKPAGKVLYISAAAVIIIAALIFIPWLQAKGFHGRLDPTAISKLDPKDLIQLQKDLITAENNARQTLAQIIGGLVVLLGLYATFKNVKVTEEGKLTERFSKAVELLGSEKLDVRLGGIYALERISRDSAKDHWTVIEVLTAFVREQTREDGTKYQQLSYEAEEADGQDEDVINSLESFLGKACPVHIQAAISVISRRKWSEKEQPDQRLDLAGSFLSRAHFTGAMLESGNFIGICLKNASLEMARLNDAILDGAELDGANLCNAELNRASLIGSQLSRAKLNNTQLNNACLKLVGKIVLA